MASGTLGLATSYPLGHRQNLLFSIISLYELLFLLLGLNGIFSNTLMLSSLSFQCCRSNDLMRPCSWPAKNARVVRLEDAGDVNPVISPVGRLISGIDTSFLGLKNSEVLALHIRVLGGHRANIISHDTFEHGLVALDWVEQVLEDHDHTKW
ncbi:nucleotide-sugar transporter family protein [Striga asiatica]|uniref:Nucleotide-sugar transporter family protein n=1 Tax=Striga asiatica TaxID=4170 RepID=A0A5A7QSF8_STRAF|nr:nucleotide-sugar transporter family protein [Striga asiatica]